MPNIDSETLAKFRLAQDGSEEEDAFEIKVKVATSESAYMVLKTGGIPFFGSSREDHCDRENGEIIIICCGEAAEQLGHVALIKEIKVLRCGKILLQEFNEGLNRIQNSLNDEINGPPPAARPYFAAYGGEALVRGLKNFLLQNFKPRTGFRLEL